ncbi:MAG: cyclic peptide export ABC transporter [Pseudomonadota bacterium]|nr:cyclic peptide export ABC transporter [Pseudomonadota bacterium]
MKLFAYLFRHSWRLVLLAVAAGAVSGVAGAGLVALINRAISAPQAIPGLGAAFFGLCLVMLLARLGAEISLLRLTQDAIQRLRLHLSQKLLATPLGRLQDLGRHRLLVILAEDINVFANAFEWVPKLFINGVLVLACLGYLAWLSWPLLAALAGFLFIGLLGFRRAEGRALAQLEQVREQKDVLYRHFRGLVEGARELQLNAGRRRHFLHRVLAPGVLRYRQCFVRGMTTYTVVANLGMVQFYLAVGLLLFLLPRWLPQEAAVLTGFTVTLLFLVQPIVDMMIALPTLREAGIALTRIQQLEGALSPPQAPPAGGNSFAQGPLHLELRGLRHGYAGDGDRQFTLGPLDLSLRQGELVFIVGGNGSGKTTLALLLLGLYEPQGGGIWLNRQPVTAANREAYRQHFAAVLSDFYLFEHLPDAPGPARRARHYLEALGLGHKVEVIDGRFSTLALSSGQRKRLALISACLEDRPVYLFDEWAADQDPAYKRLFYTELLPELKARNKLVIAITHDDAYFHCADRLIRLEDGQLRAAPAAAAATA